MKKNNFKFNKKRSSNKTTPDINKDYMLRKNKISSFFHRKKYVPMTKKEIATLLNISKKDMPYLDLMLKELENSGKIVLNKSRRYIVVKDEKKIKCIFDYKGEYGFGIIIDSDEEDIFIPAHYMSNAMNKDEVEVILDKTSNFRKSRKVGKIVNIIKRSITSVMGEIIQLSSNYYVLPLDKKIPNILISNFSKDYNIGDVVEIKITQYPTRNGNMAGDIVRNIGSKEATKTYVDALYYTHDLDKMESFSKEVEEEVSKIPSEVQTVDLLSRVDRTRENVFTIDSYEAKDLDDAISIKLNDDGTYKLSVYIADVSHYVREGTKLGEEALKRATSIYVPGSVIPMLPKKLSNGICSLSENELRLVLAIDMDIDNQGNVIKETIFKGYIKSKKKMTYENVYKALEGTDPNITEEYKEFLPDLKLMKKLADILTAKRYELGSINFDIPETKIVLDKDGNVEGIKQYPINYANKMIEEFMLISNLTVAKKFLNLNLPFIYRIHETPDEEKLRNLNEILTGYNKKLKSVKNVTPKMMQEVMEDFKSEEEKQVLSTIALRTLKLAKYSEECIGHFGLAFKYYCHFTSPIRRYPDLFIHRVISDYILNGNKLSNKDKERYEKQAPNYSMISTDREKNSTLIERDFDDLYMAIYMKDHIDEEFEARISSVTSFGMFVKLENTVEGLVHITTLNGFYEFDDKKYILKSGKTIYKIGDKVKVKLTGVDVKLKEVNFKLV